MSNMRRRLDYALDVLFVSDTERGEEERQAVPFDYSGKVILSLKDWNA
jgi:hypothetical protein